MITGYISASDYLDALRFRRAKLARWSYALCGIAIAAGVASYFFYQKNLGIIIAGTGIYGVIVGLVSSLLYLPWKVRSIHRQQKEFASPLTYTWDGEFLELKSISGQSKRPWNHYIKCEESEKLFLLYRSDILLEIFPKAWFQDQAQIDEFRSLTHRVGKIY